MSDVSRAMADLERREDALHNASLAWTCHRATTQVCHSVLDWLEVYGLQALSPGTAELVDWLANRAWGHAVRGERYEREGGIA